MTFKLTYTDGQETDYDDDTAWEVDDGVLKLGRKDGDWTVLVSPSHWAVIEVGGAELQKGDDENEDDESDDDQQTDDKSKDDKSDKSKDDKGDD